MPPDHPQARRIHQRMFLTPRELWDEAELHRVAHDHRMTSPAEQRQGRGDVALACLVKDDIVK